MGGLETFIKMPQLLFHIFVKSGRFICQDCQHGQCEEMYNNNLIWVWENVRSSWKGSPTVLRLVVQRWDNIRSICQGCQWSVPTDVRTIITYFLLARIRRLTRIDDMKVQVKVAAYHQCEPTLWVVRWYMNAVHVVQFSMDQGLRKHVSISGGWTFT